MLAIFSAVALLGICVFFHELGHFLIGKWLGVKAKIFSIGYGKGRIKFRKNRTLYQITAIPLGGYVQFFGDDPTKEYKKLRKGSFFGASPWVRMAIAAAGPFFSVLLGFIVLVILLMGGWQPTSNEINLLEVNRMTPAKKAGLQNGDKIIAVNNNKTNSFEKINYQIGIAPERKIILQIKRNKKILIVPVTAEVSKPGRPQFIGVQPIGRTYLISATDKKFSNGTIIKKEDEIFSVNGKSVGSIKDLKPILTQNIFKTVNLEIHRNAGSIMSPEKYEKINLVVPVHKEEYIHFRNIVDLQTKVKISDKTIRSGQKTTISKIFINGKNYYKWKNLKQAILQKIKKSGKNIKLSIGPVKIKADIELTQSGFLGLALGRGIDPKKANLDNGFFSSMKRSLGQIVFITESTVVGLYRIIEGKLSFNESVSGPVRIVQMAGQSVKLGWSNYWFFLAIITIILGVMNLLPIPVLDGGHIVFYLIEALYKPVPIKVIAIISRGSMFLLIGMGIYVIALDFMKIFPQYLSFLFK